MSTEGIPDSLSRYIVGRPAPQGSKTPLGRGRMKESSDYLAPWRAAIVEQITDENGEPPMRFAKGTPVEISLDFYLDRPKYMKPYEEKPFVKTPDLDKLCRGVLDALSTAGVLYNDSQVDTLRATKHYADIDLETGVYLYVSGWRL